ncbi:hypothetical protein HII31_12401 [Pseudocercospora fuligena]|uniref:Uncharacterized protein n=1 Tax=Pseudocercospora fuligena TaxID=685502 RepID=A0A8H6R850_9PEZI|nr:hypothetical protein HII31_12401 [Pseudocercospora fuligena]
MPYAPKKTINREPRGGDASSKLQFVLIEQPSDTKDKDYKRMVRSHATRLQHSRARERQRAARAAVGVAHDAEHGLFHRQQFNHASRSPGRIASGRSSALADGGASTHWQQERDTVDEEINRVQSTSNSSLALVPSSSGSPAGADSPASTGSNNDALNDFLGAYFSREVTAIRTYALSAHQAMIPPGSSLGQSFSKSVMAMRTFALDDKYSIVGRALYQLKLDFGGVLKCYERIVQTHSADFERHYASQEIVIESSHVRFLGFVFSHPLVLQIAVLLTTRYLLMALGKVDHPKSTYQLLKLRGLIISNINASLRDPTYATSDAVLVTVMMFAVHELWYTSKEAYHVHMAGLVRLVNLRGGLAQVGSEDPYFERFILWHDANASRAAGCEPYVRKVKQPSKLAAPKADTDMFRMRGAYKAT